ncbi:hypothetical protein SLEP1_g44452 [Rubroshorea leprosula]|uniref:Uncharacterized protein n=1 Tax=Rubroshorea leprosula TaxID=152421 RepID=A0AAV5LG82_9ROSI|nr:hypothetical protein SLEP1_g44452 [Rubroshorea leprosula]
MVMSLKDPNQPIKNPKLKLVFSTVSPPKDNEHLNIEYVGSSSSGLVAGNSMSKNPRNAVNLDIIVLMSICLDNDQQVYFVEIPGDESALAAKGLEHVIPRRLPSKIPLDKVFNGLRLKRGSSNSPTSPTAKKLKPSPLLRLNPLLPLPSPGNVKFP